MGACVLDAIQVMDRLIVTPFGLHASLPAQVQYNVGIISHWNISNDSAFLACYICLMDGLTNRRRSLSFVCHES